MPPVRAKTSGGEVAKRVYDFERGIVFDRTQETHDLGLFDVDFRATKGPSQRWTYGVSFKTLKGAISGAQKFRRKLEREQPYFVIVRVVNALSGEVLWES